MPRYGLIVTVVFLLFWCGTEFICGLHNVSKTALKARVKEMFLHAYYNYKNNAFPADELMPLSCKGRYRWEGVTRGDIDDALGNFSLTMLDGLDSLFLIGELDEFDSAVKAVVETVKFDSDVDVSVFETNIRVLGGLLGAHVAALAVKENNSSRMIWYKDELLKMAIDIGNRLLPAFDTPTGIPYPRINLRYGSSGLKKQEENTCTACAGTMILEFAALSRLTGDPIYEEKAAKAMAFLWKQRNRYSDLVGRVINVRNGDWIRQESGVGAGIDSYYEYLFKAYILLGEPVYLHRFQTHYEAVNRYVGGPQSAEFPFLFLDVHMHRPAQRARTFMDALLAFWPGLQVLTGDVKRAVALHELLYLIHKRNKLLPEAFTPDFNVHWGQHLLRPELIESTYLLYRATEDPYYLQVGEQIVNDLEKYTRVPCGFAAIKDVRTMEHEDQFDSFVLAETFKYLYLLFAESSDLPINLDDYIFTTEAHLLPLSLSRHPVTTSSSLNRIVKNMPQNASIPVSSLSSSSSSYLSASMSSSAVKSTPDHHGDRDVRVERLLRNAAQCMAVGYEQMQHRHTMKCLSSIKKKNNQETKKAEDDNNIKKKNSNNDEADKVVNNNKDKDSGATTTTTLSDADWHLKATCHISETPNLFYRYCVKKLPKCHNTDDVVLKYVFSKSHVWRIIDSIRQPLRQIASNLDYQSRSDHATTTTTPNNNNNIRDQSFLPLKAMDFQPDNTDHLNTLRRMGISLSFSQNGQITLTHQHNLAEDSDLAAAGILFIQELIALTNRKYSFSELSVQSRHVVVMNSPSYGFTKFTACPAHFGVFPGEELPSSQQSSTPSAAAASADEASSANSAWTPLIGPVRVVEPIDACKPIAEYAYAYPPDGYDIWNQNPTGGQQNPSISLLDSYVTMKNSRGLIFGSIGIVRRGGCVFVEKAYHLAQAGAIGVIVVDNKPETSSEIGPLFAMSGDNDFNDLMKHIHIPVVLLLGAERDQLFNIIRTHWNHTHSALNIMLTKEYNLADSFNAALSIMNTEIIREQEKLPLNNIVGDTHTSFQLISHLYQSSSVSMKTLHLNKISDTIGFSISYNNNSNSDMFHLRDSVSPSSSASSPLSTSSSPSSSSTSESPRSSSVGSDSETDEDDDVTRTETTPSDSINPLSWSFTFSINNDLERSSYFLPINENNDSLFVGDKNNNNNTVIKGSPKDISIWRDLFDTTLKQIKLNTECQHFMLAVLQISLHKVCPSDSPYYINQTIQISRRHYELINACLSELLHLNEKSIRQQEQAQPSDNNNNKGTATTNSDNNNNNPDNIVITLQLGFQLISDDDLSSTTIFPSTFSSSPPPSHPVDPHGPAADEAGVSQTTSTPTPAPLKDEL